MINSMTGFGSAAKEILKIGKISVELRSINHKFLESVIHAPDGLLSLEDKIKKEIESRLKRGRVTCGINIKSASVQGIFINRNLLKNYVLELNSAAKELKLENRLGIEELVKLPGVLSLKEDKPDGIHIWEHLKVLLIEAIGELVKTRHKEGKALAGFLRKRSGLLNKDLNLIKLRFKKAIAARVKKIIVEEEKAAFLKSADISEEMDRLSFHIGNFQQKLLRGGSVGKELDFITQEMQREANTLAAKSFDLAISARALEMKSQIEKIREQVQNIE